ncbi:MAG: glycosyltransferase family 25 protein [Planctomycetota bacterium]|jgi:hypothetical protein
MKIKKQEYEKLLKLGDQAFCSRLKRMTTHEDDAFFYVREDLFRILLEQGDPRASKISVAQKAKNLSGSMKKAASTPGGLLPVPKKVQEDRLATCGACELKHPKRWECKKCGCRLKAKTKLRGFECPVGKWGQWAEPKSFKNLDNYFDMVYCLTLPRREKRWEEFARALPNIPMFENIFKWPGVDGKTCPRPLNWRHGSGAWGCFRSHVQILEHALSHEYNRILILEDDCRFVEGFEDLFLEAVNNAPTSWGQMYLGGEHLHLKQGKPVQINDYWFQPYNVNRTHAFALQGDYIKTVYSHYLRNKSGHVDHHLGALHEQRDGRVITPKKWLAYQASGRSDVARKIFPERRWKDAEVVGNAKHNVVLVVGNHSSGTSCVAGILWHLGVGFMGAELIGRHGKNPGGHCGYEAPWLHKLLWSKIGWGTSINHAGLVDGMQSGLDQMREDAEGLPVVIKHPLLCAVRGPLQKIIGSEYKTIIVDRDLEESIKSLKAKVADDNVELHQRWLAEKKEEYVNGDHLRVSYAQVLENPEKVSKEIADFLGIEISLKDLAAVKAHVKPSKRKFKPEKKVLLRERSQQEAIKRAKKAYPQQASSDPEDRAMYYIIKSRRKGLTEEEKELFFELVEGHIDLFERWSDRWIISLIDTFAENDNPELLAIAGIRMMDKFYNTVEDRKGFEKKVSAKGMDIHTNLLKRVGSVGGPGVKEPHKRLILSYLEQQLDDPNSLWGRIRKFSKGDVLVEVRKALA